MRVLVACEFSGRVRDAFLKKGHDAYSCDLIGTLLRGSIILKTPKDDRHIVGDVTPLLMEPWDLVICHPPCTYLCNSGVHHLTNNKPRWAKMVEAASFFKKCLGANSPKICVENPIQDRYAKAIIEIHQSQIIRPCQFGHEDTKSTCLWLRGLSKLKPTKILVKTQLVGTVFNMGYSDYRGLLRSITPAGIAEAMAHQWG